MRPQFVKIEATTHARYALIDPCYSSFSTLCAASSCISAEDLPPQKHTRDDVCEAVQKCTDTIQLLENAAGAEMLAWVTLEGGGGYIVDIVPVTANAKSREISVDGGALAIMPVADDYIVEPYMAKLAHIFHPTPGTAITACWITNTADELDIQIQYHDALLDQVVTLRVIS